MSLTRPLGTTALIIVAAAFPAQEPLTDPIPDPIRKGDLVVEATDFVRAPATEESAGDAGYFSRTMLYRSNLDIIRSLFRFGLPAGFQGTVMNLGGVLMTNDAHARIQYLTPVGDGSGRLVINDLRGLLYITDENGTPPVTFMDIRTLDVGFDDSMFPNETGLAGVAFHPQFAEAGAPGFAKFYTAYSARSDSGVADYLDDDAGSHESVIREWTVDDPRANVFSGTSREVFRIGQFAPNHNVGTIAFNPTAAPGSADYGVLYASLGDAGAAYDPRDFGQSLEAPHGAIIRIDPLAGDGDKGYGVPADNPFAGEAGVAPEIWAYGLRHAQQFSWDTDGRLFMGDIGQNSIEEVNLGVPGANYGWRLREGTFATGYAVGPRRPGRLYPRPARDEQPFVYPVAQYDHDEGYAVSGGFVYRGQAIPALQGKYVFTDFPRGRVLYIDADALVPGELAEIQELRLLFDGRERDLVEVAGFSNTYAPGDRADARLGTDSAGELYLLTKSDGRVRKLGPAPAR